VIVEGDETPLTTRYGAIVVTAHLGNWELGAVALRHRGLPVSIVALPHRDAGVNAFFDRQRRRCGIHHVIPVGPHATRRSLEALRQGHVLGMAADWEFGEQGITVPFFGATAVVPKGPAVLSLRSGAPLIPAFLIREAPWRLRLHLEPPIWSPQETRGPEAVVRLTQAYVRVTEQYIRRFPTQWLTFRPIAGVSHASRSQRLHAKATVRDYSRV